MPALQENTAKFFRGTKIDLVGAIATLAWCLIACVRAVRIFSWRATDGRPYEEFVAFATVCRCRQYLEFSTRLHQRGVGLPSRKKIRFCTRGWRDASPTRNFSLSVTVRRCRQDPKFSRSKPALKQASPPGRGGSRRLTERAKTSRGALKKAIPPIKRTCQSTRSMTEWELWQVS